MQQGRYNTAGAISRVVGINPGAVWRFFILLVIISSVPLYSQQSPKIAEYEKKLQSANDNNSKIEILNSLGELYLRTEPSRARKYCLQALELSAKADNK